mgnify:CR=1 FL=1
MKSTLNFLVFAGFFTLIIVGAAPKAEVVFASNPEQEQNIAFPENVMAVIDTKCMGCHKPDAKNEKSKAKLQWVLLADMETEELVAKLDAIIESLEEGSMPPEGIVAKYPDMKLTEAETKTLKDWAESNADRLLGDG